VKRVVNPLDFLRLRTPTLPFFVGFHGSLRRGRAGHAL
jgi:hypothetical protein